MKTRSGVQVYKDFDVFSRALIGSNDVDPTYPFIKSLLKRRDYEPEWFIFCYVAFYSIETAIKMCNIFPTRHDFDPEKFKELRADGTLSKFNHERRGTARNPENQVKMFAAIIDFIEIIEQVDSGEVTAPFFDSQEIFRKNLESMPFHGGWASFKIAELFEKSLDRTSLSIPDLGLDGRDPNSTDGPVAGCRWLYGRGKTYTKNDFDEWNHFGRVLAKSWGTGIGEVETCLCKFHKFMTGKYFVGHDIQEFCELREVVGDEDYIEIMYEHFPTKFWIKQFGEGEMDFINELAKGKKSVYSKTGAILGKEFAKKYPQVNVLDAIIGRNGYKKYE